ncbi:hypothetical protein APR04_002609 [Promicromonospora umidemergens]|uniref:HEPN/Toprim N-terminal domain-containing protein n=1 Tax=Promicromonospora umidemergens TaxID=629679 RepID=A0ABP8WWI6_9MICO|nr:HEPN/Toprim-associated domain-containing protein [Promicromonospora umidemergens]MCP2283701.1 hypothetical protein [Promicromonospora umidemergens]
MGSVITLSVNGVDLDWGKNRSRENHYWLFPPGSLTEIEYVFVDGYVERKPGFQTTLEEARFRLRHLGYSQHEAEAKFSEAVTRWNRTSDLRLSFEGFRSALTSTDLAAPSPSAARRTADDNLWTRISRLFAPGGLGESMTDNFIRTLDIGIALRVLADRDENLPLPLRWHHQDLIDGGWASLEDVTDIDRRDTIINHTMLVGRLQDHVGVHTVSGFDAWLVTSEKEPT